MARIAALAAVALLVVAGCSGDDGSSAAPVDDPLDFASAPTVGGGEIQGADYAGSPTIVWFWAPW